MSEVTFQKARIEDLSEFEENFKTNIRKFFTKEYSPKTIEYFFREPFSTENIRKSILNGNLLLAKDGDNIFGFLIQIEKETGGVAFANWLAVNEEYHGKGIGSGLLKFWEEDSLSKGIHALMLCTEKYNVDFYKKCGFNLIGTMPKGYYGAEDIYFYKTIQEPNEDAFTSVRYN